MTEIGLSDGSRLHVDRPADEVRAAITAIARTRAGASEGGEWVDAGAGIHLNPAQVVYVKDLDQKPRPER